ncbi:MAG: GNAT family N-acetyltransferase [Anaerolineae bacterium]
MTGIAAAKPLFSASGLQEFRPARDLEGVAKLLERAFRDELEDEDRRWLADIGSLASSGPLARLLLRGLPVAHGMFTGYVWREAGTVVGNVSLMRVSDRAWVIANVATDPVYRRRGIGRRLMEAAVNRSLMSGARRVGLQVRTDNEAALALYRKMGFRRSGSVTTLCRRRSVADLAPVPGAVGSRAVAWSRGRRDGVRRLLDRLGALEAPWPPGPVRQMAAARATARVEDWLRGRRRRGWIVDDGGLVQGAAAVFEESRGSRHRLEAVVDASLRGHVEAALLAPALAVLARSRRVPVVAEVSEADEAVAALLRAAGFEELRTLDRLVLSLA